VKHRLDALARRYGLSESATDALRALLLHQAADEHASTTVRAPGDAVDRHVADSLVALDVPAVREASLLADLGSGAGWPGLALAAALPGTHVTLVESASRRCSYLLRAVEAAELRNVTVAHARAEEWAAEPQDVVTARALAALPVVLEYAAPLLREGGALVAWKGRRDGCEEADAAAAAAQTGLEEAEIRRVQPWEGAEHLHLYLYLKVGLTPNRFPRRPGIARKRPLQASG
jgi:16S rRNA (guanine527-N7)-methyltransferase